MQVSPLQGKTSVDLIEKNHSTAAPATASLTSYEPDVKASATLYEKQAALEKCAVQDRLFKTITSIAGKNLFFIPSEKVEEIKVATALTNEELLQALIPYAKRSSLPAISNYQVGAAALGQSGNIYLGVNIEIPDWPLNEAIHGEQCLVANARNHGEKELLMLALSAAPCGHCRQFLIEMGPSSKELLIVVPGVKDKNLDFYLPNSFGPQDLGKVGGMLTPPEEFASKHECPLTAKAIEAAQSSYAIHTDAYSGVAIQTNDGEIYKGSYIENAAYNPSLSPLQTAIAVLVADGKSYADMTNVILIEKADAKISHRKKTKGILKTIAPNASFTYVKVEAFT